MSLDLSGVLIASLVAVLIVATNDSVLITLSHLLSISYAPLAIVAIAIGLLLAIVIVLAVLISDARRRQTALLRRMAIIELSLNQSSCPKFFENENDK